MAPKYSIVIITYNQVNLIGRAIDSVLCQKEHLYEIIVSDDCSTDSTWSVIQTYYMKHPDLLKPFRNPVNLGIFAHLESTWKKITGDIIFYLSGDDELCDGLFERANALINMHNIDFKNEPVTLYFDYKRVMPNGKEIIYKNNLIMKYNPISLRIRNLISNRTTGLSKMVLDQFVPVNKTIGIFADGLIDIQTQLFTIKNYYYPFTGSVYYSDIGIDSRTTRRDALKSYILYFEELKRNIQNLSKNDVIWIQYVQYKYSFRLKPSYSTFWKYFIFLFKSIELKFGNIFVKKELREFIRLSVKKWKFFVFVNSDIKRSD